MTQPDKRKLAIGQAYCTYAWDQGLRKVVIARWEQQKRTYKSPDTDDPPAQSVRLKTSGAAAGSQIPIDFKVKIAKEIFSTLSPKEKKVVEERRQEQWKRLYNTIPEIEDSRERQEKLNLHDK